MNETKLVCTIGPASRDRIPELIDAGMSVARINFSHGYDHEHREAFHAVRKASEESGKPVGIMADLSGPKVRLGELEGGRAELVTGSTFVLGSKTVAGNAEFASTNHDGLSGDLRVGDRLLIADGSVELRVVSSSDEVATEVVRGGVVLSGAGMNVPSQRLSLPSITERDRKDLRTVLDLGFDFVAQSFVRRTEDVRSLRSMLEGKPVQLIAKIETEAAVEDADRIMTACDAIMVARGDLGVELPFQEIPIIQKSLLLKALSVGVPTIVATQMLESMLSSTRPTRAEASDVANAVLDGADAIMLSGETAIGAFPVEAALAAARITEAADQRGILPWGDRRGRVPGNEAQAIAHAAGALAQSGSVSAIVCYTTTGLTARLLSAVRPKVPILTLSPDLDVVRQLTLSKGVVPRLSQPASDTDTMLAIMEAELGRSPFGVDGSLVVLVGSNPIGAPLTNLLKVKRVGS